MFSLVFLLVTAGAPSSEDANSAVMYIQSYVTPALFDVCKASSPRMSEEYDAAFSQWLKTNRSAVTRGEAVLREQLEKAGTPFDEWMDENRKLMVGRLEAMPVPELAQGCADILQTVRDET